MAYHCEDDAHKPRQLLRRSDGPAGLDHQPVLLTDAGCLGVERLGKEAGIDLGPRPRDLEELQEALVDRAEQCRVRQAPVRRVSSLQEAQQVPLLPVRWDRPPEGLQVLDPQLGEVHPRDHAQHLLAGAEEDPWIGSRSPSGGVVCVLTRFVTGSCLFQRPLDACQLDAERVGALEIHQTDPLHPALPLPGGATPCRGRGDLELLLEGLRVHLLQEWGAEAQLGPERTRGGLRDLIPVDLPKPSRRPPATHHVGSE